MKALLFAGTADGRILAGRLDELGINLIVSVATEYGGEMLSGLPKRVSVLVGRRDAVAIAELLRRERVDIVIDATHPYAVVATENIRNAAASADVPLLRLRRNVSMAMDCRYAESAAAAAKMLNESTGRVLLATGSKDLAAYTSVIDYAERIFPRVLPTVEAIRQCESLGYRRSHIIAMQGPFSRDLNRALLKQFDISILVTKDGGEAGGFTEKIQAAEDAGVTVLVIGRPVECDGCDMKELIAIVRDRLGAKT